MGRRWRKAGEHWYIGGARARGGGVFYSGLGEWMASVWWAGKPEDVYVAPWVYKELSAAMDAVERWLRTREAIAARHTNLREKGRRR